MIVLFDLCLCRLDDESPDNIPEAYETGDNDEGIGFDEWVAVERRKDRSRRTPLRISSKCDAFFHGAFPYEEMCH